MASLKRKRKIFNQINITPLTDIFLVLLIIMMVVAPMLDQQGLTLSVPSAQEAEEQVKESNIITVDVNAKGEYFIDDEIVGDVDLKQTLEKNSKEENNGLLIRANEDATHGAVVKLMDMARSSGVFSISLVEE